MSLRGLQHSMEDADAHADGDERLLRDAGGRAVHQLRLGKVRLGDEASTTQERGDGAVNPDARAYRALRRHVQAAEKAMGQLSELRRELPPVLDLARRLALTTAYRGAYYAQSAALVEELGKLGVDVHRATPAEVGAAVRRVVGI